VSFRTWFPVRKQPGRCGACGPRSGPSDRGQPVFAISTDWVGLCFRPAGQNHRTCDPLPNLDRSQEPGDHQCLFRYFTPGSCSASASWAQSFARWRRVLPSLTLPAMATQRSMRRRAASSAVARSRSTTRPCPLVTMAAWRYLGCAAGLSA
jgi:hypothetical protein